MLFPTVDYLLFLPLTVLLYWLVPARARLVVLGLASVAFYASWKLAYLPVLAGVVAVAWGAALLLAAKEKGGSKWLLRGAVASLLAPLVVFKYWDWLAGDAEALLASMGWSVELPSVGMALPIGISFFTFQALAYVVDVGRGTIPADRNVGRFFTFIGFFPQLVAGPIVRGNELLPQLASLPNLATGQVGAGLFRIGRGLLKKLLFADILRVGIVDPLFADPSKFTGPELLVGLYAYTLQIYYDFSGYTDMAIGSARLFGIELPENFNRPYRSITVTDFWRRWHATLGLWVRHYIYFPLGGARGGMVYANLMITFLVIGVWHGASWNFVLYGALHGGAMCIQRYFRKHHGRDPAVAPPGWWAWFWRWALTFHFVVIARILFRAPDFATSAAYTGGLGRFDLLMPRFSGLSYAILVLGFVIHFTPDRWQSRLEAWAKEANPVKLALVLLAVGAACALLGTGEQLAFVYYQF